MCQGQRTACSTWIFSPTMWVWVIGFRKADMVAGAFTSQAVFLAGKQGL